MMKIRIKVKPNSKEQVIEKISENFYKINLKSAPTENKANIELIKLLKNYFKKSIKIKSGFNSRNKIIEIN
jgi:uncharacterized protein